MDSHVQRAVRFYSVTHDKKNNVVKLKWLHVEGAFGILCLGHVLCILVFCIEIVYYTIWGQKKYTPRLLLSDYHSVYQD